MPPEDRMDPKGSSRASGSLSRCYHFGVNDEAGRRHTIPYMGFVWEFILRAV